jgi:isopropylmalate/homocitrate/citramalate synthase
LAAAGRLLYDECVPANFKDGFMALNWIAAFKLIPWKDVAAVTPEIVKGAKNLWSRTKKAGDKAGEGDLAGTGYDGSVASVNRLVARIGELESEQRSASDLIKALAEQNEQLVAAVAVLRVRTRALLALFVLCVLAISVLWLQLR